MYKFVEAQNFEGLVEINSRSVFRTRRKHVIYCILHNLHVGGLALSEQHIGIFPTSIKETTKADRP